VGTTCSACREILAVPRIQGSAAGASVLGAMLFILLVNLGIVAGRFWVALAVAGGAHG
jgi:hypothetical protein